MLPFLVTQCLVVVVEPFMERNQIKKKSCIQFESINYIPKMMSTFFASDKARHFMHTLGNFYMIWFNGSENPSTENCEFGKESSNLHSVRTKTFTYFRTSSFSWLNLLGRESMFRLPMPTPFTLLNHRFLIEVNGI